MRLLVIDNTEPGDTLNEKLYRSLQFVEHDIKSYKHLPSIDTIEAEFDGVIISGAPVYYSFDSIYERVQHLEWVRQASIPIFGVCLGHQVLGHLFGAQIVEAGESENDPHKDVTVMIDDPIFNDLPREFHAMTMHKASVTCPDDFVVLAKSTLCANEAMRHKNRQLYGTQFHPELTKEIRQTLKSFAAICIREKQLEGTGKL